MELVYLRDIRLEIHYYTSNEIFNDINVLTMTLGYSCACTQYINWVDVHVLEIIYLLRKVFTHSLALNIYSNIITLRKYNFASNE